MHGQTQDLKLWAASERFRAVRAALAWVQEHGTQNPGRTRMLKVALIRTRRRQQELLRVREEAFFIK